MSIDSQAIHAQIDFKLPRYEKTPLIFGSLLIIAVSVGLLLWQPPVSASASEAQTTNLAKDTQSAVASRTSTTAAPFLPEKTALPVAQSSATPPAQPVKIVGMSKTKDETAAGQIKATLYVNGAVHVDSPLEHPIKRAEWEKQDMRLHIFNNSDTAWEQPLLILKFKDNWGEQQEIRHSLSPLNPHEAIDFPIPLADFKPTAHEYSPDCTVWVQIYLEGAKQLVNETYWCVVFDLKD